MYGRFLVDYISALLSPLLLYLVSVSLALLYSALHVVAPVMPKESNVDVLIIGAGPAGVMCANALAMAGVNVRIIDKRSVRAE